MKTQSQTLKGTAHAQVLIIDFGSQFTQLIASTAQAIGIRTVILTPAKAVVWAAQHPVKAIILSGSNKSVYDADAPKIPVEILQLMNKRDVMTLGICYGMQLLAFHFGGEVKHIPEHSEYGPAKVQVGVDSYLFERIDRNLNVWSSHGDTVTSLPTGFRTLALSENGSIAAIGDFKGKIFGLQFHPEVAHTRPGEAILRNFFWLAQCKKDWVPNNLIESIREETINNIAGLKAIIGISGGVDSSVLAAMLAPHLGDNLLGITLDGGHLREGELQQIIDTAQRIGIRHEVIDMRGMLERAFSSTTNSEAERKIFSGHYADALIQRAKAFGAEIVLQGTLAPDMIESGKTGGDLIKSHHNTGIDFGDLIQLHPLSALFKYEVREIGQKLGLPEWVFNRPPFPGPGLFLRIFGTHITQELLEVVRWATARVEEILVKHELLKTISQLVVAYDGSLTVNVKGDGRAYLGSIVVRAVESTDYMTAKGLWFPEQVAKEIISVVSAHKKVGRVFFDATDKPPGTVEYK